MTSLTYTSNPDTITLTGDVTATLACATLTITKSQTGAIINLDDGTTSVDVNYRTLVSIDGVTFRTKTNAYEHLVWLGNGGALVDMFTDQDLVLTEADPASYFTVSGTGATKYYVDRLEARFANTGIDQGMQTIELLYNNAVVVKGISAPKAYYNGNKTISDAGELVERLNKIIASAKADLPTDENGDGHVDRFGYSFTGGFAGKPVENNYIWDAGNAIQLVADTYTHMEFDSTVQAAVDAPYWSSPSPLGNDAHVGVGAFEGIHLPEGTINLFDYDYEWADGGIGRIDVSSAQPGDLLRVRMDYNVIPSIANSVIEAALDFNTRDLDDNVTFQFYLTANPSTFGNTSAGQTYLLRTEMTAYFASNEDVNALVRPVVKCNNICQIQPISILAILQK